jgi:hypothetical protein
MKPVSRILRSILLRLRGVAVFALVGGSGTGKSFRARLFAEKHGIDILIDDGLLIRGDAILTGHWAKKERSILAATRRALFDSPDHGREARAVLRASPFRRVLIVATSRRMADRIASALDLPRPSTVFPVEKLASRGEVQASTRRRLRGGSHAAPVPLVTIRLGPLSALAAGVTWLAGRPGRARRENRWTVRGVTPDGKPATGRRRIGEPAVRQIITQCVAECDPRQSVEKVRVRPAGGMYDIEVSTRFTFAPSPPCDLQQLQDSILHRLESRAGLLIRSVQILVLPVGR